MGLEPSLRPHARQCRRRHAGAQRPNPASARPERSGNQSDRPAASIAPGWSTLTAMSLFSGLKERLRDGLKRSQEYLASGLATVLEPDRPIDETLYEELEELLIGADLGAAIAADFTNRAREEVMFGTVTQAVQLRPLFRRFLVDALKP